MIARTIGSAVVLCSLVISVAEAQRSKEDPIKTSGADMLVPSVLLPFGPITNVSGQRAKATKLSQNIFFTIAAVPPGEEPPKLRQMVFLSVDRTTAGYVRFPLLIPKAKNCVGEGNAGGCFRMETKDAKVSNTGLITGKTHIISDDYIEGFTGQVWVHLLDSRKNPIAIRRAGCYGVNPRSGRDEVWSAQVPADTARMASRAEIWHVKSSCGYDRWNAVLDKAKKGAEVIGAIVKAAASQDSTSTTEPKQPTKR